MDKENNIIELQILKKVKKNKKKQIINKEFKVLFNFVDTIIYI